MTIEPLRTPRALPAPTQGGTLALVAGAARRVSGHATAQLVLASAARELRDLLGATACLVSRIEGDTLVDAAVYSLVPWTHEEDTGYLLADYPLTVDVLETGTPRIASLADPGVDPSEAFVLRRVGMGSVLLLRIRATGRPWGLVEVYADDGRAFDAEEVAVAELLLVQVEALLDRFAHEEALQRVYRETLASLSNALEAKDDYTSEHAGEVADLAVEVGRRLGLDDAALRAVELGALLHDIGKIRVPESILNKPGPLTDDEWELMRRHPEAGETILAPIAALADVVPVVRSSHERWDGQGYPDGLAGEDIPVGARIVSVCDAYRAMVEPRPYRAARDPLWAREELRRTAGTQFDPACVDALLAIVTGGERGARVVTLHRPDHLRRTA
jgi:hypothetical protein